MATIPASTSVIEEVLDFLATGPSPQQILAFRPSAESQGRLGGLLAKNRQMRLSEDEEEELDDFEQAELLMQLAKARARLAEKRTS